MVTGTKTTVGVGVGAVVGAGVGVGLGVGGGFSMTNKGDGVGRAAASLNVGDASTVIAPTTSARSVSRNRMAVRIAYYPNKLRNLSVIVAARFQ